MRLVATDLLNCACSEHRGRMADGHAAFECASLHMRIPEYGWRMVQFTVLLIDDDDAPTDADYIRLLLKETNLMFNALGEREVIGIHACVEIPLSEFNEFLKRVDKSAILPADDPHAAVAAGVILQSLAGTVRGSIIDGEQFQFLIRLIKYRTHCGVKIVPRVVNGQEHRD